MESFDDFRFSTNIWEDIADSIRKLDPEHGAVFDDTIDSGIPWRESEALNTSNSNSEVRQVILPVFSL